MIAVSKFVESITQDKFVKKAVDQVLNGNVLMMRLLRNSIPWKGGVSIEQPINITPYTQVGSYSGFDTFSTTQQNTRERASFDPSQSYVQVTLDGISQAVNQGDSAVLDLVAVEMEQRANDLKDDLGTQIYGDGTGNNNKDILGLQAAVDDSTSVTTYGGISRATYSNWRATRTAQSGSLALSDFASDFDAAQVGDNTPTLMVTTPAVFTLYEALLTPTVSHQFSMNDFRMTSDGIARVGGALAANQGFRALTFRGVPVVADEKCTSGNLYTLNEKHLMFRTIPHARHKSIKNGFVWTGFKEPVDQDGISGQFLWYGQLITDSPRTHARRTGISS